MLKGALVIAVVLELVFVIGFLVVVAVGCMYRFVTFGIGFYRGMINAPVKALGFEVILREHVGPALVGADTKAPATQSETSTT